MDISVVITTYRRPEAVKRAVDSVAQQTYPAREIWVIDDFPESDLGRWFQHYLPAVQYIRNESNRGLAASRNVGIDQAGCEWIAFLDDDDEWLPDRLKVQVEAFEQLQPAHTGNIASVQVGNRILDGEGGEIGRAMPKNRGNLEESIKKLGATTPSSSFLIRKEALVSVGGFDEQLISGIDHDIWMKLAVAGFANLAIPQALVVVHQNDSETMMTDTSKRISGIRQYVQKWTPVYREWFGEQEGERYAKKYFIRVIGRLAAGKLANSCYREGMVAVREVFSCSSGNPSLVAFAFLYIARSYLKLKF